MPVLCCLIATVQLTPVQEHLVSVHVVEVHVQELQRLIVPVQVIRVGMMSVIMGVEANAPARIIHAYLI